MVDYNNYVETQKAFKMERVDVKEAVFRALEHEAHEDGAFNALGELRKRDPNKLTGRLKARFYQLLEEYSEDEGHPIKKPQPVDDGWGPID